MLITIEKIIHSGQKFGVTIQVFHISRLFFKKSFQLTILTESFHNSRNTFKQGLVPSFSEVLGYKSHPHMSGHKWLHPWHEELLTETPTIFHSCSKCGPDSRNFFSISGCSSIRNASLPPPSLSLPLYSYLHHCWLPSSRGSSKSGTPVHPGLTQHDLWLSGSPCLGISLPQGFIIFSLFWIFLTLSLLFRKEKFQPFLLHRSHHLKTDRAGTSDIKSDREEDIS